MRQIVLGGCRVRMLIMTLLLSPVSFQTCLFKFCKLCLNFIYWQERSPACITWTDPDREICFSHVDYSYGDVMDQPYDATDAATTSVNISFIPNSIIKEKYCI